MLHTANFRLSGQKLFLDFKNPFKILAEAEPRQRRGEATFAQNPNSETWRYLLVKIRTFFDENPEEEIWMDSAGRNNLPGGMDSPCLDWFPARRRGLGRNAGGFRTDLFSKSPQFKFRFAKYAARKFRKERGVVFAPPTRAHTTSILLPKIIVEWLLSIDQSYNIC